MSNRKHSLRGLLTAALCLCATQMVRAADPNPAAKPDKAPPTLAVAESDSDGPVAIPAPGAPGLPTPPGAPGLPGPGPNTIYFQRQVASPTAPADGPDGPGPKMIIRLPEHGQFAVPDGKMITTGPGPNAMGFALPDGKMIATARRIWVNDPAMQRLLEQDAMFDHQSQELADEYRHAPKDKQDEVKKKLEDIVSRQFDGRQERRSLELKQLEDQIKQIRASIDKRNAAKKQIVDRRVSEVLGQDDTSF